MLAGETVEYTGKHFRIEDGRLLFPPVQTPYPPLYFGGSSEAANAVAAEQIDKYLTWGEPPADVKAKLDGVRALAEKAGREVSFGIRLHVIVRETAEEAWAAAERLISRLDDATIAAAQKVFARMDSVGQSRMSRLHQGRRDKLEVSPNLWAGVGLVRGGAGTALVGDPDTVAERIDEYRRIGIDTFILSGYPHLEEAYSFGELVLPQPAARPPAARTVRPRSTWGPFGETVAGDHRPQAAPGCSRPASHEDGAAPPPPGRRHPRRRPHRRRDRLPPRARATSRERSTSSSSSRASALGRGLAYSTTEPAHRINVPAAKMTLISSDCGHFMAWLAAERRALSPGTADAPRRLLPRAADLRPVRRRPASRPISPAARSGTCSAVAVSAARTGRPLPGRPLGRHLARRRPGRARDDATRCRACRPSCAASPARRGWSPIPTTTRGSPRSARPSGC